MNGTTYYYVVAADYTRGTDGGGNSANSTEVSATAIVLTPTPTPTATGSASPTPSATPTSTITPTVTPSATATATPATTLANWWKFDDGSGAVAADSADSAPGSLSGSASWVAGVDEQYAVSVGTSSFGAVNFPTTLPTAFTFSFWVRPNGFSNALGGGGADNNVLFGGEKYATSGFRSGFTSAGIFSFWTTESGGTLTLNDTSTIPTGAWTWFAITYSNNSASLYRNGNLVATASGTYIPSTASLGLDTGIGGVDYYWGSVDDARIYSSALSSSAILSLYQSLLPNPTPTPTP